MLPGFVASRCDLLRGNCARIFSIRTGLGYCIVVYRRTKSLFMCIMGFRCCLPQQIARFALAPGLRLGVVVLSLAAGIVAELLVLTGLPGTGLRRGEGDDPAAVPAAGDVSGRRYQPVHLKVHSCLQGPETPACLYL